MTSLDFEKEKLAFESYYDSNKELFKKALRFYINIIRSLLRKSDVVVVKKIEGRVKEKEECLRKFKRKYRNDLEEREQAYEIKDYITDLLGIRIERPENIETTALGATFLAGLKTGFFESANQIAEFSAIGRVFEPQMGSAQRDDIIGNWKRAIERSKGWIQH